NAIIGFTEAMQLEIFGPLGNERYVEYLKDIHQSGSHLHDLINDLLDVSAIEAGQLAIHEERLDLFALGEEVIQMMAPRARDGGVALSNRIARNFPHLRADERRMKQVLVNLLSNAVKFTPENGKITVDAGRGGDGALLIWVTDNGIGMDEQGIVTALTPFGQIDSVLTRQHEGTGLGLPLTKGLVEAHGGTLEIESDLGGGTKVLIRFPQDRKVL
ncbi:MAG: HAMP domain-containing sensor histidine kinase, partial [Rhodospirillales bacterium]|nr:HAMP domain-containing sensor histidine kinase [Rhodospirillales bacterium]